MAKSTKAAKAAKTAGGAYATAKSNQYVQRVMEDEELRDNLRDALEAARSAYGRINNGKGPVKAVANDKKVQRDLRNAADSLRVASDQIRGKKKSGGKLRKLFLLAVLSGGVALALSEGARKTLMDKLFGAEEEFEYTSSTSASGSDASGGASATGAATGGNSAGT